MRLAVLASSAFALCLTPLSAQSSGADLREEIRRIVREEIRAALKDAMKEMHSAEPEFFTKDENGLPSKAVRVVPVEKIRVVTPEKVKAGLDGEDTVTVHVLDGTGKPVTTKVLGTKKLTAKTLDGDGTVHVLFDDGTTKTIVVTPDQLKRGLKIDTGKATSTEHEVEVEVVGTEGMKEEVTKAVGECCKALEKCCEAVEECKVEAVTDLKLEPVLADPDLVMIEDVTTAKQAEKAAQKAAKKARKAEQKKAKKPHGDV
ncbi:MAG TPA: hypothetical protein VFD82_01570 [Planctomycetota bacterium]|nr:hypothetical protein [Planctomycetota bacterium]